MKKLAINNITDLSVKRTISAWSTRTGKIEFESNALTWGQLKSELLNRGFSIENSRVTEGNTQLDLVNEDAILPTNIKVRDSITNNLVILATPNKKIDSGSIDINTASYKELKAEVKEIFANSDIRQLAKEHFGNYTQSTTETLRTNLKSWLLQHLKKSGTKNIRANNRQKQLDIAELKDAQESLINGNYKKEVLSKPNLDVNKYNEALEYILIGINMLQNEVHKTSSANIPTDQELEEMYKKLM